MLYRHSEVFRTLIAVADLSLVAGAWLLSYWIRFHTLVPVVRGLPDPEIYFKALLVIVPLWFLLLRSQGLYQARRVSSLLGEAGSILRVTTTGVVVLVAINFFLGGYYYSRGVVGIFSVFAPALVISFRVGVRLMLRSLRRRGYNLRFVLVVGDGPLAEAVIERIHDRPEMGLRVRGVLSESPLPDKQICGISIIGDYSALKTLVRNREQRVDQVILALAREEGVQLEKALAELDDEIVNVNLVPDLLHVMTLHSSIENLDGMPIINLRETPLVGWAAIGKRVFDLLASSLALVIACPVMLSIAGIILLTSGRPILYTQERMGLDGRVFWMLKFRSMVDRAEDQSGPVFTDPDDSRRTGFGAFLRRYSLDELPQFWNVLLGDMSLVGPRPERPVFIEQFRCDIPGYMLRHKVKAGLTGWAQVNGWRGSTSISERINHDLYYIRNWSIGLDIRIMLMTFWRGVFNSNAY